MQNVDHAGPPANLFLYQQMWQKNCNPVYVTKMLMYKPFVC